MKNLKRVLLILIIVLGIAQCFGPKKNNASLTTVNTFISETQAPEDVVAILKSACFDCHSNHTRYPWYNAITPVNYWMAHHVEEGKEHFNVSVWSNYSVKKKDHKFEELIEEVIEKEMPLNSYTWTHGDAKLTDDQINAVVAWAKKVRQQYAIKMLRPE